MQPASNQTGNFREKFMRACAKYFVTCAALIAGTFMVMPAWAADYPDHPVKMIAPFAAGGPSDIMARILADKLSTDRKSVV